MSLKRILIVDDEPDVTSTLKIALKDNGFEDVDVYNDASSALLKFKSNAYGLILLDVAMPKIDGFKLYQEMKKRDDTINVFFDYIQIQIRSSERFIFGRGSGH